jgi:ribulose-phosphate 3-epimerase
MTVEPGFSGQNFINKMICKISSLRKIIDDNNYDCFIEIDGGVNPSTALTCVDAGADVLVSGNYIFSSNNLKFAVKSLLI